MPCVSSQFIFTDVDTESVKGEMPLLRSWSRIGNRCFPLHFLLLSRTRQWILAKVLQMVLVGPTKQLTALLDSSYFHCAAFWDTERKLRIRTVPQAQKGPSHASGKYNLGPNVAGLTGPSWASCQAGQRIPCSTWELWAWDTSSIHQNIPMDRFGGEKLCVFSLIRAAVCHVTGLVL